MDHLSTLGIVSLRSNGAELLAGRRKVLALLAFLVRRGGPVERAELSRLLWPQADESRAKHSLRQALSELKSALGDGLDVTATHVRVAGDAVHLDVTAFEQEAAADRWDEAAARWRGDFLAGHEDIAGEAWTSWLDSERRRLAALRDRALGARSVLPAPSIVPEPRARTGPRWTARGGGREERRKGGWEEGRKEGKEEGRKEGKEDGRIGGWEEGRMEGRAGEGAPVVVREASFGQMGTLSTDARAVLEAASVLGTRAPTGPLTMMMAGLSTAAFASAAAELAGRGMLRPSPRHDALDFPSEGARQQVYRLVAPDRRRTLHAAAARALAAMPPHTVNLETTAEHERLAIAPRPRRNGGSLVLAVVAVAVVVMAAAYYFFLRT